MRIWFVIGMVFVMALSLGSPAYAQSFNLRDSNPLPTDIDDVGDIVRAISGSLFGIAVPIAALMYIYAGVKMMLSRGKAEAYREAGRIVLYTSIGLAIILIGEGFVSLIRSIIELGG